MGRFHAKTVAEDPDAELEYVCDIRPDRAEAIGREFDASVLEVPSVDVDALVVASPTGSHARYARLGAEAGVPCLLEKPVALSSEYSAFVAGYPNVYVGHCERFNPVFDHVRMPVAGQLWARRLAPPTLRSRDIDVVLDLMIHDLDLLLHFGGDLISAEIGRCVFGPDGIDELSVKLVTLSGIAASLSASRVSTHAERRWDFPDSGMSLDLLAPSRLQRSDGSPAGPDALARQWEAFKDELDGKATVLATALEGHRALLVAERICGLVTGSRHAWAS